MNLIEEFNLVYRHKDFKIEVFRKLDGQSDFEIEARATKEARIVYNWNRQVAGCYQRSRAFSRLKINEHSIVYGEIEPEHYVEDLVAEWFLSRFPLFTVIIGSKRGTFVVSKDKDLEKFDKGIDELLPKFEKRLPKNEILAELGSFKEDDFWESYYDSQFIKERKNTKYFLKNMPKKFHEWGSLELERKKFRKDKLLTTYSS